MFRDNIIKTFKEFDINNISYAYIRDESSFENALTTNSFDIDIIVKSEDLDRLKNILNNNLFFNIFGHKAFYFLNKNIWFDVHYDIYERYPQLNIANALSKKKHNGLFYHLGEKELFKVLLLHPMDLTGFRGERKHTKDKEKFLFLSKVNRKVIKTELEDDFGKKFSENIMNYLEQKDFDNIKKLNILFKFFMYCYRPQYLKFMFTRLKKKISSENGKLIVFVGVDGSGKTTTAENTMKFIKKYFRDNNGDKVKYFYLGSLAGYILPIGKLAKIKNFIRKFIYKNRTEITLKKNNTVNKSKNSIVKEVFFFFEYFLRYIKLMYMLKLKKQIVVTDRYLYDSFRRDNIDSECVKLFLNIFPKPDYIFFMKGDTKEFFNRKGEYTPEILNNHQDDLYNGLKQKNIKFKEIDALKLQDEILIDVLKELSD